MSSLKISRIERGMRIYNEATQDYFDSLDGTISLRNRNNLETMSRLEALGYVIATVLHPVKSYRALRGTKFDKDSVLEEWWQ